MNFAGELLGLFSIKFHQSERNQRSQLVLQIGSTQCGARQMIGLILNEKGNEMGRQKSQNGKYSILLVWCLLVVFPHGVSACTDSNVFADYFDENATFQDLKSAVSKSVRISVGTVTGKRSFWSGDQTIILTEYRVEILEGIKGKPANHDDCLGRGNHRGPPIGCFGCPPYHGQQRLPVRLG